jgi:hypothetical protein
MTIKFLNRSFFQRIFGSPAIPKGIEPSGYWYFVNDLEFFSANRISQSDSITIEAR